MKAVRLHEYGPPSVLVYEDAPRPQPQAGQVAVQIYAAGVGVWDAEIRRGEWRDMIDYPMPLILGTDVAGKVAETGSGVTNLRVGQDVYGVVDMTLSGSNAEIGLGRAAALSPKPSTLSYEEAAAVPVVAVTAWQMLFDLAGVKARQTVLIHGAGGNVGRFAVQFAKRAGATVIGTASARDLDDVRALGADQILDYKGKPFEQIVRNVDVVIDLVGGDTRRRSWDVLKEGGILVAASEELSEEDTQVARRKNVRAAFVEVDVTANLLARLTELLDARQITTKVGAILPLAQARRAHEMIEAHQQPSGKLVLKVR
ncbi:MAG: Alcohol dehydrogenase zinc-binding domain protein [Gammaproteobacteria bacterium]|nr:Alcohol dehydrogenase zinc-binding domain protein [Gammaproteobacteria bacterium]